MTYLRLDEDSPEERKTLDQLVVSRMFKVSKVIGVSHATSITPNSELVIGGRSPSYGGGYTSRLELSVVPEDMSLPINSLIFNGYSPVLAGYLVEAKIPRYETKRDIGASLKAIQADLRALEVADASRNVHLMERARTRGDGSIVEIYVDRPFRAKELAIELAILSPDRSPLRIDRGVEYDNYFPKKK